MKSIILEDMESKKKKKSKPHIFDIQQIFPTDWIETIDDEIEWTKEVDSYFSSAKNKNSSKSSSQDLPQHNNFQQSGNNNNSRNIDSLSSSSPGDLSQQCQNYIQPIEKSIESNYTRCINYILDSEETVKDVDVSARINLLCLRDNVQAFCGNVPGNGDCFFHAVNVVKTYLESETNLILKTPKEINAKTSIFKNQLHDYLVTFKQNDLESYNAAPLHEIYDTMIDRLKVKRTVGTMPDNIPVYALVIKEVFHYTVHTILMNEYKTDWISFDGIYTMPQVLYNNKEEKEIFVLLITRDNSDESAHYYPIFPICF